VKDPLTDTTALLRGIEPEERDGGPAACLVMIAGPDLGRRIDLRPGELTVGRESHCDIVVPLGGVSRVHCSIRAGGVGVFLHDVGSTNGTRVNGQTVRAREDVPLRAGDLIAVGGAMFKLFGGDHVLQRIAALMAQQARREDCVARYGGDEFAIVMPETDRGGALVFGERLRGAVEQEEIRAGETRIEVTISVGVAEWSPNMTRPEDLIAAGDVSLYEAKHAGRNRVA